MRDTHLWAHKRDWDNKFYIWNPFRRKKGNMLLPLDSTLLSQKQKLKTTHITGLDRVGLMEMWKVFFGGEGRWVLSSFFIFLCDLLPTQRQNCYVFWAILKLGIPAHTMMPSPFMGTLLLNDETNVNTKKNNNNQILQNSTQTLLPVSRTGTPEEQ